MNIIKLMEEIKLNTSILNSDGPSKPKMKFRIKKDKQYLTRKQKKLVQKHIEMISLLDPDGLRKYLNLTDPNNQFIRKLTLGGDEGLKELQQKQIWQSII